MRFCSLVCLLVLMLAQAPAGLAQPSDSTQTTRPKIGLVLGGGGALGLSHVGIIQRLEEEGIRPDIVVGTSIGAVVGATYTSGYSGAELSVLVDDLDWENMFADASHRSRLNFRRKQDDVDFPIRLKIGIGKDGLKLPRGAIEGQKLYFELTRLINTRNPGARFSNLDRPFKAIATDLENKETVILSEGDLTRAVFASMAVPGILPPVQIGDHLLVDGGLANNLPISIARQMGADIIIAVDLSRPPKLAADINNVFDVVGQLAAFITLQQAEIELEGLTEIDILIKPDLTGFSPIDFEKGNELVLVGRQAVDAVLPQLQNLARAIKTAPVAGITTIATTPFIVAIELDNQTSTSDELIWANLHIEDNAPLDQQQLAKDITDLYGYDLFSRVDYRLIEQEDGTHLQLSLQEQAAGDGFLRFGFAMQSNFENEGAFNAQVSYTRRNLNRLGAEWRSVLRIGNDPGLSTEWYQPLTARQDWFVSAGLDAIRTNFALFDDTNTSVGELRFDNLSIQAALGKTVGRIGEFRVGIEHSWTRIERSIGFVGFPKQSEKSTDMFAGFRLDTFDSLSFPATGWRGEIKFDASLTGDFNTFEDKTLSFQLSHAMPFAGGTLIPNVEAGLALDLEAGGIGSQSLGGFLELSGLAPFSRLGNHKAFGSLVWYRPVTDTTGLISWPLYLGFSLEAGNVFERLEDIRFSNMTKAGSVFIAAPTPIGPVYLATGITEHGDTSVYLFVGQTF